MPISRITDWVASEAWKTWLASADSPTEPSTAEKASSTGTPAATKAPNAISRITKVTGTDSFSAFWKSLLIVLLVHRARFPELGDREARARLLRLATASSKGC